MLRLRGRHPELAADLAPAYLAALERAKQLATALLREPPRVRGRLASKALAGPAGWAIVGNLSRPASFSMQNVLTQALQMVDRPVREELDELTLARAKRGDRAAFGALVRFYERPVFALLSRMLFAGAQRDLVEDLAQETFVRAYRAIGGFGDDGRQRLSSWLFTIATRVAIDALRRSAPVTLPLDETIDILPCAEGADDALTRRTLRAAIETAVAQLPVTYRAVFLLREVHEFSYEAIAEALEVDLGTVKSRLARARAALRAALRGVYP